MQNIEENTADLKELMTAPPMTAKQHAETMRKKLEHRRMIEDAREITKLGQRDFQNMK